MSSAPARGKNSKSNRSSISRRLSLNGYQVTQVCVTPSFVEILLGEKQGSIAIGITTPFSIQENGKKNTLDPKNSKTLAPIMILLSKEAKHLEVYRDGSLKLMMMDGMELTVSKGASAEAWFTSGTEQLEALDMEKDSSPPKKQKKVRA